MQRRTGLHSSRDRPRRAGVFQLCQADSAGALFFEHGREYGEISAV